MESAQDSCYRQTQVNFFCQCKDKLISTKLRNRKREACNHYGCTREVATARKKRKSCSRLSREQLQLLECLANLSSASITRLLHSYNVYHFCYNIIKSGNNFHLPSIGRVSHRYYKRVDVCCHLRA